MTVTSTNYGVCNECRKRVPAEHVVRDGRVYLRKDCPDCGPTEALVSSDADRWQLKRRMCHYEEGAAPLHCTLQCETCGFDHNPRMVFLDVTNRCNMNCPICIANIPGMGFEFHPPLAYFEHILTELGKRDPKPLVQLFGGEPTVRDDLFEIIEMARSNGLDARIVTNGLKLADEEYCKKLCDYKVHVLLAFDGNDPAIYQRLRQNPGAHAKKLKALENLKKHSRHKNTIMCCVARGINDQHMRGLIDFCHENRSSIKCLHCIPLTETWEEGEFETGVSTTTEDVEQIIDEAFPEDRVEFIPAGLTEHLRRAAQFFGVLRLKFGGAHPNCESAAVLVSDGQRYWPLSHYLKMPLEEVAEQVVARCEKMDARLSRLDPQKALPAAARPAAHHPEVRRAGPQGHRPAQAAEGQPLPDRPEDPGRPARWQVVEDADSQARQRARRYADGGAAVRGVPLRRVGAAAELLDGFRLRGPGDGRGQDHPGLHVGHVQERSPAPHSGQIQEGPASRRFAGLMGEVTWATPRASRTSAVTARRASPTCA